MYIMPFLTWVLNAHKMIDVECDLQKLEADLEYHEQKVRLINNELDRKNEILSTVMRRAELIRRARGRTNEN